MILLIDNYDSFTFNLAQQLTGAGADVCVLRNDAESVSQLLARRPAGIVVSPGPGRPESAGVCLDLLARQPRIPLLGVCLGHQALGLACGARVERAARLMHGKASPVRHSGSGLFAGLAQPLMAGRYHSLEVPEASLPEVLEAHAWCDDDGALMAMRHRRLPWWGIQFHPESVLTPLGSRLIDNFLRLCGGEEADDER